MQHSPFSLDVPSPRRVSFCLFQSLSHVPSLLYTTLYLQRAVHFLQPILLLTISKYCCVVWHTLFLLAFYTQTGSSALFLTAPHITCIYHIPLIPLSFYILLFLSLALVNDVLLGSVLHFNQPGSVSLNCFGIFLWSFFSAKFHCLFLFLFSNQDLFQFFHLFFHSVNLLCQ